MSPSRRHHPSPLIRTLSLLASDLGLVLIAILVIVGVYLLDSVTPLGTPVWLLYFIPLVLAYWSDRLFAIPVIGIATLVFLVTGFLVSPGGIPVNIAIVNRFTFLLAYIAAAIILWAIRRGESLR